MRKKKIFIGCSKHENPLAQDAKKMLEPEFEVSIWDDNLWETDTPAFSMNDNILQGLLRATLQFDFAIMLGTKDDKVDFKGIEVLQARDNVLFELGLFIGRMGFSNCAFIVEEKLNIPTDLGGIVLNRFNKTEPSSFIEAIAKTKAFFNHHNDSSVNFFPSSTLAAVYFENFILPTCRYFISNNGFERDGINFSAHQCIIKIIIPKKIGGDLNLQFDKYKNANPTDGISITVSGRVRKLYLEIDTKDEALTFVDFPTVLSGISHAIRYLLPHESNLVDAASEAILSREMERFISTLKMLSVKVEIDDMLEYHSI